MERCQFITGDSLHLRGVDSGLLKKIVNTLTVSPAAAGTEELSGKKLVLPLEGPGSESKQWPCFA